MDDRAYSKRQIFWGTILGGPLAGIYFLRANFLAKADFDRAQKTLVYGLALFAGFMLAVPFVPEGAVSIALPLGWAFGVQAFYEQYQLSMKGRPRYSNWRVTGISLLMWIPLIIASIVIVILYDWLGWIDLEELPAE